MKSSTPRVLDHENVIWCVYDIFLNGKKFSRNISTNHAGNHKTSLSKPQFCWAFKTRMSNSAELISDSAQSSLFCLIPGPHLAISIVLLFFFKNIFYWIEFYFIEKNILLKYLNNLTNTIFRHNFAFKFS